MYYLPPMVVRQNGFTYSEEDENYSQQEVDFQENIFRSIPLVKKASSDTVLNIKISNVKKNKSFN